MTTRFCITPLVHWQSWATKMARLMPWSGLSAQVSPAEIGFRTTRIGIGSATIRAFKLWFSDSGVRNNLRLLATCTLATNCLAALFYQEWDQRQRSDAIKPPPPQNSCGRQSDDQHDREITADNRFDGVCAQRTRV